MARNSETSRQAAAAAPAPAPAPASDTVRVACTSDRHPWTHERPLRFGEVAEVPAGVAASLIEAGLARIAP
jgi:hypothetical protein